MTKGRKPKMSLNDQLRTFIECMGELQKNGKWNNNSEVSLVNLVELYASKAEYTTVTARQHLKQFTNVFNMVKRGRGIWVSYTKDAGKHTIFGYDNNFQKAEEQLLKVCLPNVTSAKTSVLAPSSRELIETKCNAIRDFLVAKNEQYGDSVFTPIRIFSDSDEAEQLRVRIDDKLNRLMQGNDSLESDYDVIKDLIGYLILYLIHLEG